MADGEREQIFGHMDPVAAAEGTTPWATVFVGPDGTFTLTVRAAAGQVAECPLAPADAIRLRDAIDHALRHRAPQPG